MKTNLPCEVVRDLLPSYKDGLTSEITNEAVEEHLAGCEECSQTLERMCDPIEPAVVQPKEDKTIDFLKKVRRVDRWKLIAACVAVLVLVGVGIKLVQTYVGRDITDYVDEIQISFEDGVLTADGSVQAGNLTVLRAHLEPMNVKNAQGQSLSGYYKLQVEGTDYRPARTSKERVADFHTEKKVNGNVKAVYRANGGVVWSEDENITMETKTFNESVMEQYTLMRQDGEVKGSLVWFFDFETIIGTAEDTLSWDGKELTIKMDKAARHDVEMLYVDYAERYSCALMAGIKKLDSVKFVWVCDEEGEQTKQFTREDANTLAGGDVLELGSTLAGQQKLFEKLELVNDHWYSASTRPVVDFSVTDE